MNKWEASAAGTFGGFTSSSLDAGSWPTPSCPVREAFDSWPVMFTPLGYDAASDATANFTASDGVTGQPFVLLGRRYRLGRRRSPRARVVRCSRERRLAGKIRRHPGFRSRQSATR